MNKITNVKMAILLSLIVTGCSENERVARIDTEAADRQASQNQEMVRLNREVAEGTRRMVEADAESRREIVEVHQDLQSERSELSDQWNTLESERQVIAQQRRTESMIVPVSQAIGVTLLTAMVIGFCWMLLFGLRQSEGVDAQLTELLVRDIVSDQPRLCSRDLMPAITDSASDEDGSDRLLADTHER